MHAVLTPRSGQAVSHYRIEELIGSGGMGEVYRATDLRLGRPVALKFLRPLADEALRQRMMHEAQAASHLDHPNICTIFEVDETAAREIFIAMAYYEGETLDRLLAKGPLAHDRALSIAIQAARGLAAAHEELVVHRDIKPGNLMLTRGDTVKILDFGLAKQLREVTTTDPGIVVGTPAYMAPEQLRGEAVDQRADIWSLGAVLYEMVTGARPFAGEAMGPVIASILGDTPTRPTLLRPGLPSGIERVLDRALQKNARLRYEHIGEMIHELVQVQSGLDPSGITQHVPTVTVRSSLAVLPLQDMSESQDQAFLCDGIAEEILHALNRVPQLRVASRTSAFQFRNRTVDIREIGAMLNVDAVLEGSLRRVGDRLRISAQLVSVKDGYRLWYERFDREMKDIFAIEDEIAEQIAVALKVALSAPAAALAGQGAEPDAQAYEFYLQGRQFFHQHRRKSLETALQIFAQAIELHPNYARAYTGIADCHSFLRLYFGLGEEATLAADRASAKALELAPELPEAQVSRGFALYLRREFDAAEQHLRHAIELNPRLYYPHYIFARLCFQRGRIEEAAARYAEACALVPEAFDAWYLLGMCYRRMGQEKRARSAELECIEAVKRWVRVHPDDTRAWTMGAAVLAALGEPERAVHWVQRALAVDAEEPIIEYNAACVYVALGRFDEALSCLSVALREGGLSREWVTNDPDLDPLRSDSRFEQLVSQATD
jgi:serine/threonine protein kinase/tetratricopeptide (TPR) repeat protein